MRKKRSYSEDVKICCLNDLLISTGTIIIKSKIVCEVTSENVELEEDRVYILYAKNGNQFKRWKVKIGKQINNNGDRCFRYEAEKKDTRSINR